MTVATTTTGRVSSARPGRTSTATAATPATTSSPETSPPSARMAKCTVVSGHLEDPYTARGIDYQRGRATSSAVQIDHLVPLKNAWQSGARNLSQERRVQLANDPLNLLAVDGPTNQAKSDKDAREWLPANAAFQCQYVERQVMVKAKYGLWVTNSERGAMAGVLDRCQQ